MRGLTISVLMGSMLGLALGGCMSRKPADVARTDIEFRLEEYFEGQTRAYGLFEDRFGKVRRQFVVDITGTVGGDLLTLDENFRYADGELDRRVWHIRNLGGGRYEGQASDIVGTAKGEIFGNALNWRYTLDLKVGEGTWRVQFDDWMFLQPDGVLLNRARVSKWGIELGEVTLAFQRLSGGPETGGEARSRARQSPGAAALSSK